MTDENLAKQACIFGVLVSFILLVLGFIMYGDGHLVLALIISVLAAVCTFLSLHFPSFYTRPLNLWLAIGTLIHRIISPVILLFIFFLIITPFAIVSRLFRKNMPYSKYTNQASNWQSPSKPRRGIDTFRDQF